MLRAHADGPQRLGKLQGRINWAAEATLRGSISTLRDAGALEKRRTDHASNAVATALTPAGEEMLSVARSLERWLQQCPNGPIAIDGEHAKVAVKALTGGWSSALMRELATSPRSLTELSSLIADVSYPSLERRIGWMRASGQLIAVPRETRGTPYAPTDWLRRAVAPLCVAGRCERRHIDDPPPITDVEVEAAFLLTLPLVQLPRTTNGTCLLASRTDPAVEEEEGPQLAGVALELVGGTVTSATPELIDEPTTWAIGTAEVWLDAVVDGSFEHLRIGGGDPQLAIELIQSLHFAYFTDR